MSNKDKREDVKSMKKCNGGLDTIIATVVMVALVVAVLIGSVVGLSRQSGSTINKSVEGITDVQQNTQVSAEGGEFIL